jgi:hypothetical protein
MRMHVQYFCAHSFHYPSVRWKKGLNKREKRGERIYEDCRQTGKAIWGTENETATWWRAHNARACAEQGRGRHWEHRSVSRQVHFTMFSCLTHNDLRGRTRNAAVTRPKVARRPNRALGLEGVCGSRCTQPGSVGLLDGQRSHSRL